MTKTYQHLDASEQNQVWAPNPEKVLFWTVAGMELRLWLARKTTDEILEKLVRCIIKNVAGKSSEPFDAY